VEELAERVELREALRAALEGIGDLERLAGRVGARSAGPRDVAHVAVALGCVAEVRAALAGARAELLGALAGALDQLPEVAAEVAATLVDAPPPAARAARLRTPADAGRCGALRHADAARARGARARGRGAPARARDASLRGAAGHGGGTPPDARAHGGRARDAGRARLARRGSTPPGLRAARHHARPDAHHPRRPPSGRGGGGGRRLRPQRRAPRSR